MEEFLENIWDLWALLLLLKYIRPYQTKQTPKASYTQIWNS